ncbi:MAG: hypothetical protein JXA82_06820 [Sedimentisphaerales bacterium]|nr:hypothetical protein [Sedimentisphaerales bacterium]
MDEDTKQHIEKATKIAFEKYAERHPTLGNFLEAKRSDLLAWAVETIQNDPEVEEAIQMARTESDLQKLIEIAENYLPKLIGIF